MSDVPKYESDAVMLAKMQPEKRASFKAWMAKLDEEAAKVEHPYGKGSFWETTGAECWLGFFEDGYGPKAALQEDLSCDGW